LIKTPSIPTVGVGEATTISNNLVLQLLSIDGRIS